MQALLRPAELTDAAFLYRLRTDPETQAQSFGPAPVDLEVHTAWLKRTLADTFQRLLLVYELDGLPVGTARLDFSAGFRAELSYTVAPEHRGKGIATDMIAEACSIAQAQAIEWITAQVKEGNVASRKALIRNGFTVESVADGVQHFIKHLPAGQNEGL